MPTSAFAQYPIADPYAGDHPLVIVQGPSPPAEVMPTVVVAPSPTQPPAPTPERPGTHFLLELDLGAVDVFTGISCDATFGYGGTPFGSPIPVYLIAEVGFTSSTAGGQLAGGTFRDERGYADLTLGLRVYVPIGSVFRLFAEGSAGPAWSHSTFSRDGFSTLDEDGWYAAGLLGGGFQLRILYELSIGLRMQALITSDDLATFRRSALAHNETPPIRTQVSATWHF